MFLFLSIFLLILLHYGLVVWIIPTALLAVEVHVQISMVTGGSTEERHRSLGPSSADHFTFRWPFAKSTLDAYEVTANETIC